MNDKLDIFLTCVRLKVLFFFLVTIISTSLSEESADFKNMNFEMVWMI